MELPDYGLRFPTFTYSILRSEGVFIRGISQAFVVSVKSRLSKRAQPKTQE